MAASTLNPSAPVWTPIQGSHPEQQRNSNSISPTTPSTPLSSNAAPFVPQPQFHPINSSYYNQPYDSFNHSPSYSYYAPQDPFAAQAYYPNYHYHYQPPPPYQEYSGAPAQWPGADESGVHAYDPFARQMRQVDNMRTEGYYPHGNAVDWGNGEGVGQVKRKKKGGKRKKKGKKGRGGKGDEGGEEVGGAKTERFARKDSQMQDEEGQEVGAGGEEEEGVQE
jgi:hypothetical protein